MGKLYLARFDSNPLNPEANFEAHLDDVVSAMSFYHREAGDDRDGSDYPAFDYAITSTEPGASQFLDRYHRRMGSGLLLPRFELPELDQDAITQRETTDGEAGRVHDAIAAVVDEVLTPIERSNKIVFAVTSTMVASGINRFLNESEAGQARRVALDKVSLIGALDVQYFQVDRITE